ncbi:MAG: SDR family NAD(P)-dependent oxidoreductase [Rhodococcus sp. (in: high G+C Gram-positive bacteria)]|uniref:SDR family NAD(P)-dependent oxidoreductase n=1 Tax=Rhodococcus sp. TaxID=1831 RepID=UPI002AD63553|nr:SDR family NAD(P)-dependent oxidoreductase [Rhodococcus sp. (in: high G+C Gram-positive bacteria)]
MSGIKDPHLVVVTGAGSGIGQATALLFAERGAQLVCVDIDEASAKATAAACGSTSVAYTCDVGDATAVAELAQSVQSDLGPVDVLVNNAGVGLGGDFRDYTIEDWAWIRSVNLDGVVNGCHAFGSEMIERGRGHVVNVSSGLGYLPSRRTTAYCTTKAAVLMLSQCLRADWSRHGVGVSAVCPGFTNTPILDATRLRGVDARERGMFAWALGHGRSPRFVAAAIVRATERNRGIVPVGPESVATYHALRVLPAALRELGGRL